MSDHVFTIDAPVEEGYRKLLQIEGKPILFLMTETGPAVIDAICPHAEAPLFDGRIMGDRIRCARHGYAFNLKTGACARAAREGFSELKVYDAQLDGTTLTIRT